MFQRAAVYGLSGEDVPNPAETRCARVGGYGEGVCPLRVEGEGVRRNSLRGELEGAPLKMKTHTIYLKKEKKERKPLKPRWC